MYLGLEIEQLWWDSDLSEVQVRVSNGCFAGVTTFYVVRDALAKLADELDGFPRTLDDQRDCTLATLDSDSGRGGARLRLRVLDHAGHCELAVELRASRPGLRQFSDQCVSLSLRVDPGSIDALVASLRAIRPETCETFRIPVSG